MRISSSRVFFFGLIALLLGLALYLTFGRHTASQPAMPVATPVSVIQVQQQDVPHYLSAIGAVQSLHSVQIRPQVEGVLTRILVKEGQPVQAGDLLATLDDRS
ncbi:MAG: biotin/lipoyl-binding protein, partial [Pseudomonas sp.]|nr:biotin/lipoyl-binding protein [Pseudomonas sp.]